MRLQSGEMGSRARPPVTGTGVTSAVANMCQEASYNRCMGPILSSPPPWVDLSEIALPHVQLAWLRDRSARPLQFDRQVTAPPEREQVVIEGERAPLNGKAARRPSEGPHA